MVPDNEQIMQIIADFQELRRGRGLLSSDIHTRISPRLRLACGIAETDPPATARHKLALGITERCGRLSADLRLAVLAALAMHEATDQQFLHARMEWAADQFDRDPRTAHRRMNEGFRMLAIQLNSPADPRDMCNDFAPDGWYVESLRSTLRLDLPLPKLVEERRIVAAVDELDELVAGLGAVRAPGDERDEHEIRSEMVYGGEIVETRRLVPTYARFVVRLPQPLKLGERHEYAVEFTAYPRERFQPYYTLTPLRRVDRFSLKIRFGTEQVPGKLWRLNGVPGRVADAFVPTDDLLTMDSVGEVAMEFHNLRQGVRYGVQWEG